MFSYSNATIVSILIHSLRVCPVLAVISFVITFSLKVKNRDIYLTTTNSASITVLSTLPGAAPASVES